MNIIVIGLGQGGAVAAMKLAKMGFTVDLFEQDARENVGHPWYDDIRFDVFEACGLPLPERSCYTQKGKRLFISPDEKNRLRVPSAKPMEEISISRPALSAHLAKLCRDAGVCLHYGTRVDALLIEDGTVTGVTVNGTERHARLVIDSSGLFSPFRAQVPKKFGVQAQPGPTDVMFAWRGFFNHVPGTPAPDPDRNIYIKHQNGVGLSWCNLNDRDEVDVFVGRIGALSQEERERAVAALFKNHDFFGETVLRPGRTGAIALRMPLARMVADGYVALGDAAFMTMPMMGSGIEASMKAATWLAELILKENLTRFTAAALWPWQVRYYKELGARYAFVDIVKRWVLNIDVELLNWLFGCGAVTDEDMGLVSTDPNNPNKLTAVKILKKAAIVLQRPRILAETGKWMARAAYAKAVANAIPPVYDEKKIAAWQARYDSIIEKI